MCEPVGKTSGPWDNWAAFPAGVKFDPSDEQLLHHLRGAVGHGNVNQHPLIKNYISFLDGGDGICQTHPENLPGVKMDGSSRHFFHRPAKAYNTGTRKRRKIHSEDDELGVETRWHKTGKTRPVYENGQILGWKKIMVLYKSTGEKKSKPEKTNWILHQYHLGQTEEETDGELVVCKVFFQKQPRQCTGVRHGDSDPDDLNPGSTRKARGDPAQSGKSDVTVGGSDMQEVFPEQIPALPLNEARAPDLHPSCASEGQGNAPVVLTNLEGYPKNYCLAEEVSTSDNPHAGKNDNHGVGANGVISGEEDEPPQVQPGPGGELPQSDFDWTELICEEGMDDLRDLIFGSSNELQDLNPHPEYTNLSDPTLTMDLCFLPDESAAWDNIPQSWPPSASLDNADSLSGT